MENKETKPKQVQDHDSSYKQMFKFAEVVQRAIEYCSKNEHTEFNFDSLTECSSEFFTDKRERRLVDSLWSVTYGSEGQTVVFALIEFQKTLSKKLLCRVFEYVFLLYLSWWDKYGLSRPLPLILPIVIYSGPPRKRKFEITELRFLQSPCPEWMKKYQPQFEIRIIDMNEVDGEGGVSDDAFMNLKHLTQSTSIDDLRKRKAAVVMAMPELSEQLEIAIEKWCETMVLSRYAKNREDLVKLIQAEKDMTKEERIFQGAMEYFAQEGRQEGLLEGLQRGRQEVVANLLKSKMPDADICAAAKLTAEELNQIKQELAV